MDFTFIGTASGKPGFLKVRDGFYVRPGDISVVGLAGSDEQQAPLDTVVVHLESGVVVAFDPCDSESSAAAMAESLVSALVKVYAWPAS